MIKLYKKEKDKIRYAECWPSGDLIIEHTGIVGDPGQIEQYPLADKAAYEEFLFSFQMNYGNLRYEEWDPAHGHWIVIQFPVSAMDLEHFNPAEEDVELREQVCSLLTEALGWNGAGEVDGWEFGKLFQDPQKYVLNIFCITIDVQIAQKIILETLTDNIDCSVMKLAVKEDGDDTYRLYYSADGSKEFSL